MMQRMMPEVRLFALLWIVIGILLCLVLVAAFTWLFVQWSNSRKASAAKYRPLPQDSAQM